MILKHTCKLSAYLKQSFNKFISLTNSRGNRPVENYLQYVDITHTRYL